MGKGSNERRPRGLRDIRTTRELQASRPPSLGVGAGPVERAPERPRTWVFVKQARLERYQGLLLVDPLAEPDVRLREEEQTLVVFANLPGVREEDVDVRVNGDVLTLSTRSATPEQPRYYRELLLPFSAAPEGMRRAFQNGVLELELARAAPPEPAGSNPP